eukprot:CAMPEP_0170454680 /NCGR_PEP_ID=MMETSP0123-20130129/2848_1 /TAXON_ID=182087 /ORGANISM="Favella ehrenbergii, Strain Fehren 1" /LENGTH=74 /DNA_ID=CAMNT_0010717467 /DNA_START=925 /DNA_END=1149 /DNA_ORIENTATION=+
MNQCKFKHERLNQHELQRFMVDNEDFLMKQLQETGQTNLREVFLNYLREKDRKHQESLVPKNVMMPKELIKAPQ